MNGWDDLVQALPVYLPGCKAWADWWHPVAVPAFKPNVTMIFKRSQCKQDEAVQ